MGMKIALAGGGTAGHVNPLLAVAEELRRRGDDIVVIGTEEGLEHRLVPEAGFEMVTIARVPLPRRPSPDLLTLPRRLREAERVCQSVLEDCDALVGFGGYVSTPAYRAAAHMGRPFLIHEQNARPGLANRWGARTADVVALTFQSTPLKASEGRTVVTGLPLRPAIADLATIRRGEGGRLQARREAAQRLGISPDSRTLLITGGSLGARHINEVLSESSGDIPADIQVIHLTGKGKADDVRGVLEREGIDASRWIVMEYLDQMQDALAVADLVVCRSGAGTVAELQALGIPALYVPLPIGNGEQKLNATDHVNSGGAVICDDSAFNRKVVDDLLVPLLEDGDRLAEMARLSADTGRIDAASEVADLVASMVDGSKAER